MKKKKSFGVFVVLLCTAMLINICTACGSDSSASRTVAEKKPVAQSSAASENPLSSMGNSSVDEKAEPKKLAYIKSFDLKSGLITFDPIEWVMKEDKERIKELGLNAEDDFPNGFYIYNPSEQTESLKLSKKAEIYIILWNNVGVAVEDKSINKVGLDKRLKEADASGFPYELTIKGGEIIKIQEQYVS